VKLLSTSAATWSSVSTTSVIGSIVEIAAGTNYNERVGRWIDIHDLRLTLTLLGGQSNIVTDDVYNCVRVVVFKARSDFSAAFTLTTVFSPAMLAGIERVYFDRTVPLIPPGHDTTGYQTAVRQLNLVVPLRTRLSYQSANANSSDPSRIFLGLVSDSVAASNPGLAAGSGIVTTFVDP